MISSDKVAQQLAAKPNYDRCTIFDVIVDVIVDDIVDVIVDVIVDTFINKEGNEVNVKRELGFIDSLIFMAARFDQLSSNTKIDQFVNLKKYYKGNQENIRIGLIFG